MKSEAETINVDIDYVFSPKAIRDRAEEIFALTMRGDTGFIYHREKLAGVVDFVIQVIRKNYPNLQVPFHSRWGHFNAGKINRVARLHDRLAGLNPLEKARTKIDLAVVSVLLDAGAGTKWQYTEEPRKSYGRSEGLAIASLSMFISGAFSSRPGQLQADSAALKKITAADLKRHFQVSAQNPLIGVEGRAQLLNGLGQLVENRELFSNGRPGDILNRLLKKYPKKIPATAILRAVLEDFGPIWPGRIHSNGVNLGDVWYYPKLDTLVPFHKLSQWMTYSLLEPIIDAGIEVTGVSEMTGLPEYRNGGLM
ncbi:MAG: DUF1688 family protein, partial [Patescibacteria group bacterium]|nr:DUF1688 family protein [Patescibacteria group bacterium]